MAFPFILESNFEVGTNAEWTSETDSAAQLDIVHVKDLSVVNVTGMGPLAPFRGAYCARWRLGANTTDAYFTSTTIDVSDAGTSYFRWYIFFGKDFIFTADDIVSIFKLTQAGGGTVEATVGLSLTATTQAILIGASDGTAAATFGTAQVTRGEWHCIELKYKCDTNSGGTIDLYLDGQSQVVLTTLDNAAAIGDGILGVMDRLATTKGTILMDLFIQDDTRVYPIVDRYPNNVLLTKSGHVFVGPGIIDNISLLSGNGTDCVLSIFDTNHGNTNDANKVVLELKNVTANDIVDPAGVPVRVNRGCYVSLSGTTPRAMVNIKWAPGYGSVGAVRNIASRLTVNPLEAL